MKFPGAYRFLVFLFAIGVVVSHSAASVVLGLLWLLAPLAARENLYSWRRDTTTLLLVAMTVWATLTSLAAGVGIGGIGRFYYYTPLALVPFLDLSEAQIKPMVLTMIAVCAVTVGVAFAYHNVGVELPVLSMTYKGNRLAAFFNHPIPAAAVFSTLGLVGISLVFLSDLAGSARTLLAVSTVALVFGLVLTQSRGFYISFSLVVFGMILHSRKKNMFAAAVIVFLGAACIVFFNKEILQRFATLFDLGFKSNAERLAMWRVALEVISESWGNFFLGIGFGAWAGKARGYFELYYPSMPQAAEYKHVHNMYLQVFLETGLVGFLIYLSFVGSLLVRLFRALVRRKRGSFAHAFTYGVFMAMTCYLLSGLFDYLHMPDILFPLCLFVGLALVPFGIDNGALRAAPQSDGEASIAAR